MDTDRVTKINKLKQILSAFITNENEDSSSSSSSGSSSEEEDAYFDLMAARAVYSFLRGKKKPVAPKTKIGFVKRVVHNLTDKQFKLHFRMSRTTAAKVDELFANSPEIYERRKVGGGRPEVPKSHYVFILLWYLGKKCSYRQIAKVFGISLSTSARAIKRMLNVLNKNAAKYICFPATTEEKQRSADDFEKVAGFPNVIGCIDQSYINIKKPAFEPRESYTNRHAHTSIALQAICDADSKFLDVYTGAPYLTEDGRLFQMSPVSKKLYSVCEDAHFHILCDDGYPLREWLMTPKPGEHTYNEKLARTRLPVKNSFGLLKKRFRQLQQLDCFSVEKVSNIVVACCVLHNICVAEGDEGFSTKSAKVEVFDESDCGRVGGELSAREALLERLGEMKRTDLISSFNASPDATESEAPILLQDFPDVPFILSISIVQPPTTSDT